MMFDQLPAELRLKTLAYLTVRDLRNAQLVSRSWREFFIANESAIYRHAAVVHGLAPDSEASLAEVCSRGPIAGAEDWKDLLKRRFRLETNWQGLTQPKVKEFRASEDGVHRIKVDEDAGYIITTSRDVGGLWVTDLYRNEVLWALPKDHVCAFAHCEYGNGYIIFNRIGSGKEVWRRASDFDNETPPAASLPDYFQLRAYTDAATIYHSDTLRGHFRPWALITMPISARAFRFVYPHLLVASEGQAFVWDIPTMLNIITIHDTQAVVDGAVLGRINYVEMNDRYIIICGSQQLRIFSKSPQGALLFHIPGSQSTYAPSALDLSNLSNEYEHGTRDVVLIPRATSKHVNDVIAPPPTDLVEAMRFDDFVAAHITPCGSVLVALLSYGRIIIVSNVERVVNGEVPFAHSALEINLHSSPLATPTIFLQRHSTYLALGEGRIAVATRDGIYVITLNYRAHGIVAPKETDLQSQEAISQPFPDLAVCQAVCFDDPELLSTLSCLQMTATSLFFTWLLPVMPESPRLQASPDVPEQSHVEFHSADEVDELGSFGLLDADRDESMYEENDNDQALRAADESNDAMQLVGSSTQPHWGEDNGSLSMPELEFSDDSSDSSNDSRYPTVVCIDFLPG